LALLAFAYSRTGLPELAEKNIALLKLNFPQHASFNPQGEFRYGRDYNLEQRSLLNRLSFGLLDPPRTPLFDSRKS
ncbi:MAG: outer membrane protein assembly factor BamD, partial [Pseudomonadales bacterium]|nr:outer membrane protein assembly factor BamD [Pseudomonadales bacterium]